MYLCNSILKLNGSFYLNGHLVSTIWNVGSKLVVGEVFSPLGHPHPFSGVGQWCLSFHRVHFAVLIYWLINFGFLIDQKARRWSRSAATSALRNVKCEWWRCCCVATNLLSQIRKKTSSVRGRILNGSRNSLTGRRRVFYLGILIRKVCEFDPGWHWCLSDLFCGRWSLTAPVIFHISADMERGNEWHWRISKIGTRMRSAAEEWVLFLITFE